MLASLSTTVGSPVASASAARTGDAAEAGQVRRVADDAVAVDQPGRADTRRVHLGRVGRSSLDDARRSRRASSGHGVRRRQPLLAQHRAVLVDEHAEHLGAADVETDGDSRRAHARSILRTPDGVTAARGRRRSTASRARGPRVACRRGGRRPRALRREHRLGRVDHVFTASTSSWAAATRCSVASGCASCSTSTSAARVPSGSRRSSRRATGTVAAPGRPVVGAVDAGSSERPGRRADLDVGSTRPGRRARRRDRGRRTGSGPASGITHRHQTSTNSTTSRSPSRRAPPTSRRRRLSGSTSARRCGPTGDEQLTVAPAELDVVLSVNGSCTDSTSASPSASTRNGSTSVSRAGGIGVAVEPSPRTRRAGRSRPAPRSRARPSSMRHRRERVRDHVELLRLRLLPALEPRIDELGREQPVRDHRVDVVAEQREVRVRAPRFGDDQPLGVHDEPRARDVAVGQQLAHAVEPLVELAAPRRTRRRPRSACRPRARAAGGSRAVTALRVEHPVHVPTEHVGQRQQPDRLRGRRAVDHHEVVVAGVANSLMSASGEHLVEPGDHRQLLGFDGPGAGPVEHATRYSRTAPHASSSRTRASSCDAVEARRDRGRPVAERDREDVGERVRGIGRADDRAQPEPARAHGRRGRDGGLADAALAGEQQDAHQRSEATRTPAAGLRLVASRPPSSAP